MLLQCKKSKFKKYGSGCAFLKNADPDMIIKKNEDPDPRQQNFS